MEPFAVLNERTSGPFVFTCEHASCEVPVEYDDLGLDRDQLQEHIAWDIGARNLTVNLARRFDAPAVLAGVSRLVIDCNRDLADHDLIVSQSHGVQVPGNLEVDADERHRRITQFYEPYHEAVDALLRRHRDRFLVSVHTFTPVLNGRERRLDVGVLFDVYADEAQRLGTALAGAGLRVRYNEPYSGLDGLIYSAARHGGHHGAPYLELEVNNALLRDPTAVERIALDIARGLDVLTD